MTSDTHADPDARTDGGLTVNKVAQRVEQTSMLERFKIPIALVALVVFLRPVVAHEWMAGYGQVATTMLIWMLFVAGFNLLLGFTGVLSFGHAMFLGFGMYGVGIGLSKFGLPFTVGALIGIAFTAVVAYTIGSLIAEKGEIYFAMLTIAFGQAFYFIVNYNPWGLTEGSDGISQNTLPWWIETYRGEKFVPFLPEMINDWYWVVGLVFIVALLALWQIIRSPFGRTLVAIRENEMLARAMGVDTVQYKIVSFTFSAIFAAIAGALLEINDQGAVLETFHWTTSGDAVLMSVLGGMNYFAGPLAGVFVWLFSEDYLTDFETLVLPLSEVPLLTIEVAGILNHWRFFLGLLFVAIILSSPREGVWGFVVRGAERVRDRIEEVRG
jgi:branched-chain amino acid transport system permease protein